MLNDERLTQALRQPLAHRARDGIGRGTGRSRYDPAHRPRRVGLRRCDARDRRQRGSAGRQMQKLSAGKFHVEPPSHHSITSSARANKIGETSKPKALAVLRLTTNSNMVPCSTGRSAGFAPLRILSTKVAERYQVSLRLTE